MRGSFGRNMIALNVIGTAKSRNGVEAQLMTLPALFMLVAASVIGDAQFSIAADADSVPTNNEFCDAWRLSIDRRLSSIRQQCSGPPCEVQFEFCRDMEAQISDEIKKYNQSCG